MGKIKVQRVNSANSMQIAVGNSDYAVTVTNNRAEYFSEQAKKYRDEAKISRDEAKYYAEQNSNVTYEYIENLKNNLVQQINTKQIQGNYALSSEIPTKVSELENDLSFVNNEDLTQELQQVASAKANVDLSNISESVDVLDGQWVMKYQNLIQTNAVGSYSYNLGHTGENALNYLPNDTFSYEVMVKLQINSNTNCRLTAGTKPNPLTENIYYSFNVTARTASTCTLAETVAIIPVDSAKMLYSQIDMGAAAKSTNLVLVGYRRIGTNQ